MEPTHALTGKSRDAGEPKPKHTLRFEAASIGQSCPPLCPQAKPECEAEVGALWKDPLGEPLGIREVAELIGCSIWTVRQRHLPGGLPCLRSGSNGKLIFYKNQVIRWLLSAQQKGGRSA